MHKRITMTTALLLGAMALAIASCGQDGDGDGSGGNGGFADCGNGSIDGDEQCDDGNQADEDGCLGTCQLNVCGDGITNPAAEACDITLVPPSDECDNLPLLGFTGGTLACAADCTLDTSGCSQDGPVATPTPVVTATPDGGVPTPTDDGGVATPTATPTPSGGGGTACNPGDPVVVVVAIDATYGAARIDLAYPASNVNVPGSGTAPSVVERVVFAGTGLTTVNDDDNVATLTASLVSFNEQPAGTFAIITFDCVASVPPASAFTCTVVSASSPGGVAIDDAGCSVSLQ